MNCSSPRFGRFDLLRASQALKKCGIEVASRIQTVQTGRRYVGMQYRHRKSCPRRLPQQIVSMAAFRYHSRQMVCGGFLRWSGPGRPRSMDPDCPTNGGNVNPPPRTASIRWRALSTSKTNKLKSPITVANHGSLFRKTALLLLPIQLDIGHRFPVTVDRIGR